MISQGHSNAREENSNLEESHCLLRFSWFSVEKLTVPLIDNHSALYTGKIVGRFMVVWCKLEEVAGLRDGQHSNLFSSFSFFNSWLSASRPYTLKSSAPSWVLAVVCYVMYSTSSHCFLIYSFTHFFIKYILIISKNVSMMIASYPCLEQVNKTDPTCYYWPQVTHAKLITLQLTDQHNTDCWQYIFLLLGKIPSFQV